MLESADYEHMARALRLARRGLYSTSPNPRVGCVLVRDGRVVGEGWHVKPGEAHAEIAALREAGEAARQATAYVTLEPCCHHGRTPPCTDALIGANVARAVVAMEDPHPRVNGGGIRALRESGVEVEVGMLEREAEALNPGFLSLARRQRPWIRVKLATSLDGRTALASGESRWITGPMARRDVQRLRARADAILTGVSTVVTDDPSLNVRLTAEELGLQELPRQPLRIVLDTRLRFPPEANLLRLPGSTLIFTAAEQRPGLRPDEVSQVEIVRVPQRGQHLDLHAVTAELARREVGEVQVEAGPRLVGALLRSALVDEMVVYLAPHLLGTSARGFAELPGLENMSQRVPLEIIEVRAVGRDLRIDVRPLS